MRCPVCSAEIVDLYPKPRCRACGYIERCCQPELPRPIPPSSEIREMDEELSEIDD
jgi:hypothetical protein